MANLPDCNPDVYKNGKCCMIIANIPKEIIELIVQHIAKETGDKVDWHYVGGRARVLTLGDPLKAAQHKPMVMIP